MKLLRILSSRATAPVVAMDEVTDRWIKSDRTGLIIFGGYGIGKTTYSLHLAKRFSEDYIKGKSFRIPIRIPLGGMYTKQDLTALICSALSGRDTGTIVPNFSFAVFLEMSRNGQFVLLLDGFDEMRHAMNLDDFVFTFEQMQPLFVGDAKVIILGRPDSFLSNKEEDKVISALFDGGVDSSRQIDRVEVAFFSKAEIELYLRVYLDNRGIKLTEQQQWNCDKLMAKLPNVEDNILSRPVQLRMFTSMLEEALSDGFILTRYQIYQKFIYRFLKREENKAARKGKQLQESGNVLRGERAIFMQDIAWWILTVKKENRFVASDIPTQMIPSQLRMQYDTPSAIREALVGSVIEPISTFGVLDKKAKKFYYFPHKSYIEFLVTEYFVRTKFTIDNYKVIMSIINPEMLSFIEEREECLGDQNVFDSDVKNASGIALLRERLKYILGHADLRIVQTCAKDKNISIELKKVANFNRPSEIYVHYLYLRDCDNRNNTSAYLRTRLAQSKIIGTTAAILNCLSCELQESGDVNTCRILFNSCFTTVFFKKHGNLRQSALGPGTKRQDPTDDIGMYIYDKEALLASVLLQCFSFDEKKLTLKCHLTHLTTQAERGSKGAMFVPIAPRKVNYRVIDVTLDSIRRKISEEWIPTLDSIIIGRKVNKLFPVLLKGDAERLL
jgi:hypothetical protein